MTERTMSDAPADSVGQEPIRQPHSIRFTEDEWTAIQEAAELFRIEPAVFVRRISLKKLVELGPEIERRRAVPKDKELF